eukprot:TRINITY_DN4215_c0_g1_i1.p1 TRINITY_DN4215_c0_g1~~TRINITY_DN4215_c0_g1_i1.p1  ORF type:complete len:511 (-),score=94.91 TRINITY_DN4215_c0_g1_i1:165-1697(-)
MCHLGQYVRLCIFAAGISISLAHERLRIGADSYPTYQELYYSQTLDHFNPASKARWQHRYLLNDKNWDGRGILANGCRGPILLYTGNEGPIDGFWASNGFMIQVLAPKWGALLLFPEQRFYGKSMPFGNDSFKTEHLSYLTTNQVLEDYAELIYHIKGSLKGAEGCPVVAFGGSYGGTLTALLRASHPAAVVGGLAASSELGYYDIAGWASHGVNEFAFEDVVVQDYKDAEPRCLEAIDAAKRTIAEASEEELVKAFNLCNAKGLGPTKTSTFTYALEGLPQEDYPYTIGAMPAKPVTYVCQALVKALVSTHSTTEDQKRQDFLEAAGSVIRLSFGSNGSQCIPDYGVGGPGNTPGDGPGLGSWGWQSCTETLHEFSARTIRNYSFNYESSAKLCSDLYGASVTPDVTALAQKFGGYALAEGTAGVKNIIWSHGTLDPWHGWFQNMKTPPVGSEVYHFLMKGSAHHLDLKAPNAADPSDVTAARAQYEKIIYRWIQEFAGSETKTEIVVV